MSGRTPPPRTPEQQKVHDRIAVLRTGTPAAARAWATLYEVPLIGADDDELLLIAIHEAREELFTGAARRKSIHWLGVNRDRIKQAREGQAGG